MQEVLRVGSGGGLQAQLSRGRTLELGPAYSPPLPSPCRLGVAVWEDAESGTYGGPGKGVNTVPHPVPKEGIPLLHPPPLPVLLVAPVPEAHRQGGGQIEVGMVLHLEVQVGLRGVPGVAALPDHLPPPHPFPRPYPYASPAQVGQEAVLPVRVTDQHVVAKRAPGQEVYGPGPGSVPMPILDQESILSPPESVRPLVESRRSFSLSPLAGMSNPLHLPRVFRLKPASIKGDNL